MLFCCFQKECRANEQPPAINKIRPRIASGFFGKTFSQCVLQVTVVTFLKSFGKKYGE